MKTTQPICRATSTAFFLVIAGGLLAGAPAFAAEGRMFHVRDFGAVPDGKMDSVSAIRAAIAAAMDAAKTAGSPVEVVLEAGTYRVQPERPRGVCFPLHQTASLTVRGAGKDTKLLPNDRLQVLDPKTGCLRGEVRAVDVKVEQREFLLTLDKPLEGAVAGAAHRSADTLFNLDACGAGFQIRGNHMRGNRRYGCLLRAGGGAVENNTFEDTTGAGVVLTNEPDWPEGPVPWGITIRGNRFLRGGTCLGYADSPHGAALSLRPTRLGHGLAEAEAIRDVIDPRPGTTAAVEIGSDVAPAALGSRISGLKATLDSQSQPFIDRRTEPSKPVPPRPLDSRNKLTPGDRP